MVEGCGVVEKRKDGEEAPRRENYKEGVGGMEERNPEPQEK